MIGFFDDYFKIKSRTHKGLNKKPRIFLEILFAGVFVVYQGRNYTPVVSNFMNITFLNYIWGVLIIVSCANAFNLTDGVDSLSGSMFIYSLIFLIFCGNNHYFYYSLLCVVASYLILNWPPAKIIMGDTGALGLGAIMGGAYYNANLELWLLLSGFVFVIQTVVSIIQICAINYFKHRVFLMSPLHHHFQKLGYPRWKILLIFHILAIIMLIFALFLFNILAISL
jgi:phospho-N-acetylmuramoyl-pentapeptide-transferase